MGGEAQFGTSATLRSCRNYAALDYLTPQFPSHLWANTVHMLENNSEVATNCVKRVV